ncbi:hypothetical protein [Aureliella helgolandensis]|uniref:Uncharacterized protein n=1 Tax=Aureliella helgolandensis TaxID=2527968 RepID=A0A518G0A7_9BACT|nr:hypothetical protein [Aureliella helgolandensis]QDV22033.1 hypothetical protein Q31a_03120 [Aureliella helgolandensis]
MEAISVAGMRFYVISPLKKTAVGPSNMAESPQSGQSTLGGSCFPDQNQSSYCQHVADMNMTGAVRVLAAPKR